MRPADQCHFILESKQLNSRGQKKSQHKIDLPQNKFIELCIIIKDNYCRATTEIPEKLHCVHKTKKLLVQNMKSADREI